MRARSAFASSHVPWHSVSMGRRRVEIVGDVSDVETIAVGRAIRELGRLRKRYGAGRWRKMKGVARIRLADGRLRRAEIHWYEAHGIGRKELKRKRYVFES